MEQKENSYDSTQIIYDKDNNFYKKAKKWLEIVDYGKRRYFTYKPETSALLVIDMQNYFLDVNSHAYIPFSKDILPNVKSLIQAYREKKLPIIFTRHAVKNNEEEGIMAKWWGGSMFDGTYNSEISKELKPLDSEIVIRKTRYSAFQKTDLNEMLINKGVKSVIITGVMTHLCCETTAREAFMNDFEVYFTVDATGSASEELHLCSLRTLSHGFAIPLLTKEILEEIKSGKN